MNRRPTPVLPRLTYDVIGTLTSVTSPGHTPSDRSSCGRLGIESSLLLAAYSVNPLHSSSLPPRLLKPASDRLYWLSLQTGPHSFRLSPGDRGRRGRILKDTHPRSSISVSNWLQWVPVGTPSAADWSTDRRSVRHRHRPRWVFVVGPRSRRSRRKRQDNGDPGRRVRLPIQRCGQ